MSISPNMDLILPDVSATIGPQWASILNTALERVDLHDHTSDLGVAVPTAGLNINADLPIHGYSIYGIGFLTLDTLLADPTTDQSVYSKGGDLYYVNSGGTAVQITDGNNLASLPGAISGLGDGGSSGSYDDGTDTLFFRYKDNKAAKFDIATIQVHPYVFDVDRSADYVSITAPTALSGNYTLTLPTSLPAADNIVGISSTGVLTAGAAAGSFTAPSISFASDLDTGMYRFGANELGFTAGGVRQMEMRSSYVRTQVPHAFADGTAAAPGITFENDQDNGFYRITTNAVGLTLAGVQRIDFSPNAFVLKPNGSEAGRFVPAQLQMVSGSAAVPAYSFGSDQDTGMYLNSANTLRFATGGSARVSIDSGGLTTFQGITSQDYIQADGGIRSGEVTSSHNIKWKVFTGTSGSTIDGGTIVTVSAPSGIILGSLGMVLAPSLGVWRNIEYNGTQTAAFVNGNSGDTSISVINVSGSTQAFSYKIILYYI